MRTIVFGDIHGRRIWKDFINKYNPDKIIFIGDYFDSFDYPALIQMENFKDIIALKDSRPDDVVLLIGNHDAHYMGIGAQYAGFQVGARFNIEPLLAENKDKLQWIHSVDSFLFTHAGVTNTWCNNYSIVREDIVNDINSLDVSFFRSTGTESSGDSVDSSPIWVRPNSLRKDAIDRWTQVVGHTAQDNIKLDGSNIVLIDTLGSKQALLIEDGKLSVAKVSRRKNY